MAAVGKRMYKYNVIQKYGGKNKTRDIIKKDKNNIAPTKWILQVLNIRMQDIHKVDEYSGSQN